nr:helix-turn-helix transcriptional regulator [Streptomyces smaragdinus]
MDREWSDPALDLEAVAARAGYSRFHFVRVFRDAYGETPGSYLARRRIERARELLRTCDLTVTEICAAVGFAALGTFCSRFKQVTGMTPVEYRDAHVGRGAAMVPGCYALLWTGGFRPRTDRNSEEAGDGPAVLR